MKPSKRLRLLRWRKPEIKPLILRTSWGDFAHRMRAAIILDMAILLGDIDPETLEELHKTQPLPALANDAPTQAEPRPRYWWWNDETAREDVAKLATVPVSAR